MSQSAAPAKPFPFTRVGAALLVSQSMAMAHALPIGKRRKPPRGNKYALCRCGSHQPTAKCCGARGE